MKKIVFCLQTMVLGGVEKELITVFNQIHDKFDITLLLLYQEDFEIMREIPNDININILNIDKNYYCGSTLKLVKQRLKKGKFFEASTIVTKRCFKSGVTGANINIDDIPELEEHFDIAVCYHIHSPLMLKYVIKKIKSDKKIAWIHNDFYTTGYPIQRLKKYIVEYDEFVSVSKKVEKEFREFCPWYQGGISTAYNYLDANKILLLSEEILQDQIFLYEKKLKILTVGRFVEQKGIDMAIKVCALLKKENMEFHWFLIGYGPLEEFYRQMIQEYDIDDCFTIIGRKENPYPYIKNCDICVQPSRHEAYPLVIMEAKILSKPIVCTNFDGADEQITNGINGIIVPLGDTEALCNEIKRLIRSPQHRIAFSKELEKWHAEDDLQTIVKHFE